MLEVFQQPGDTLAVLEGPSRIRGPRPSFRRAAEN